MARLLRLAEFFDYPARAIGKVAGYVILPLIALIIFDVITRKIDFVRLWIAEHNISWFNPIIFQDAEWHLHAIIVLLTMGFGYLMNAHVRVDIFREMLPRRGQAWVEFWGLVILGIPYLLVISYFAWEFVEMSVRQNEGSESLTGIPSRYFIKSTLIIGFLLLLSSLIATLMRIIVVLFGDRASAAEAIENLRVFAHEDVQIEVEAVKEDIVGGGDRP